MSEFNLIDEPWIPCIGLDGTSQELGIRDTLHGAHELREICDDSPLVTVALHRLLLAILYRAHEGPTSFREWYGVFQAGKFDGKKVDGYLSQWKDRFYLFDEKRPFFQMGDLETGRPVPINRLATECASGNNATLFDHSTDEAVLAWPPARIARQLIACQAFALGFGKSSSAVIAGREEPRPYAADGIALRGMNVWLQGNSLFETLCINLIPDSEDDSLPPWELDEPHKYRDRGSGASRQVFSAFGTVDRFTWQSRLIRLIHENPGTSRMYFTQGRSADKASGDPMKTYRMTKEEGVSAIPLSSGKAAWREAHAILSLPAPGTAEQRPACFNLLARAREDGLVPDAVSFNAHIVGLASAPNKAGKFLLWRHERMPVSADLLNSRQIIERLGTLLLHAEQLATVLYRRTHALVKRYLRPQGDNGEAGEPDPDAVATLVDALDPRPRYWARLEQHFIVCIDALPDDWDAGAGTWKPDNDQLATTTWRTAIKREAQAALEECVRALGTTARAIAAIAQVRTVIADADLNPPSPKKTNKQRKSRSRKGGNPS